jgi:hypothetical protein
MNNAIRTRFDRWNKGEEPLEPPSPDVIDLNKQEEQEEVFTKFCGSAGGYDLFVERIDD